MARNLLVATNPTRRRKQSAKQRAASLRNLRKARAARKSPKRRRRNPSTATNPRRRKTSTRRRAVRRATTRRNPVRRMSVKGIVERQLMPAAVGGAGAVANDLAYTLLMTKLLGNQTGEFVEQFRSGSLRHVGKAISALALTYVAGLGLSRRTADQLGAGAITVVGYNVVRDVLGRVAPQLPLGAYVEPALGYAGAGLTVPGTLPARGSNYRSSGLSAYLRPKLAGLPQLTTRGQLKQPDPFTARAPRRSGYEGYE